jgi:uncharacterized protein YutE (UPF0331/DUF86 family)
VTRPEVVRKLLAALTERTARIARLAAPDEATLAANEDALDLVSFNLMLAVQASCDVAAHIISDEGLPATSSLAEGFVRLAEHGVITKTTATQLARAVGFRNVVAHAYHRIDPKVAHAASTSGRADLEAFAREVSAWLIAQQGR